MMKIEIQLTHTKKVYALDFDHHHHELLTPLFIVPYMISLEFVVNLAAAMM